MNWTALVFICGAALLVWVAIRLVRQNPGAFSRVNLSKSIFTLGILTLFIIASVAICVVILK